MSAHACVLATRYNEITGISDHADRLRAALDAADTDEDKFADRVLTLQRDLINREVRHLLDNVQDLYSYDAALLREGL